MESAHAPSQVTALLRLVGADSDRAFRDEVSGRLLALLYGELRGIAARLLRRERSDHTLQPTALVHEAYLKLLRENGVTWEDRAHFLGVASRAMRQILVDGARRRAAEKRRGGLRRVTLPPDELLDPSDEIAVLELNDALHRLAELDERAARVAEFRLFGGMTVREIALVLGVSARTVDGDWATARAWLGREVRGRDP